MDSLTYKCPGCGNNLVYDINSGLFRCDSCGQYYKLKTDSASEKSETQSNENIAAGNANAGMNIEKSETDSEYMDVRVYHCSSCGSEIMTNDVEVSKFCSYCGQSTIMYDRVSKEKRPQKIIPFVITKDKAIALAREAFSHGKYSFDCMDQVTTDSVYGIYMPYWCYRSKMSIQASIDVKGEKGSVRTYDHNVEEKDDILLDASKRFKDSVSIQLNPYSMMFAKDFDMGYLSGFYADRSDVNSREEDAKKYFRDEITESMLDKTPGVVPRAARDMYTGLFDYRRMYNINIKQEKYELVSTIYMFVPVYFITFRLNDKTVIILVNGQTGKIFGSIPIDDKKFKAAQMRDRIIWSAVFGLSGALIFRYLPIWWAAFLFFLITGFITSAGKKSKNDFFAYYKETNSEDMFDISKNREG